MTGQSVLCMPKDRPPSSVASVTAHSCALASASIAPSMHTLAARKNVVRWMPWTRCRCSESMPVKSRPRQEQTENSETALSCEPGAPPSAGTIWPRLFTSCPQRRVIFLESRRIEARVLAHHQSAAEVDEEDHQHEPELCVGPAASRQPQVSHLPFFSQCCRRLQRGCVEQPVLLFGGFRRGIRASGLSRASGGS